MAETNLHPTFARIMENQKRATELLVQDLTGTRPSDTSRVRDGLQIAMDGLGNDTDARLLHEVLVCCHWLVSPSSRVDVAEEMTDRLVDAADKLRGRFQ